MADPFYIISKIKILAAFNFHRFASSAKIGRINRWNFLVLQYTNVHAWWILYVSTFEDIYECEQAMGAGWRNLGETAIFTKKNMLYLL